MNPRFWILVSALALAAAVTFGAFGAHALRAVLAPEALGIYRTAVEYHVWNALGLLCVGALMEQWPAARALLWAARLLATGLLLFCGSLYLLALSGKTWLGAITPVGGGAFIAAWLLVAWAAFEHHQETSGNEKRL